MNEQEKAAAEKAKMQNVVQQMLPDDLKKQFVLQKNTEGGLEKSAQKPPLTFDATGNVATSGAAAPVTKLDPKLVQKAIRTFETDLAEALAEKNGSSASISIAEKKKKDDEARKSEVAQPAPAPVVPPAPQPVRPIVKPIAPTAATAIPGATISIPPTIVRDLNLEIKEALQNANPKPQVQVPPPVVPPPQPVAPAPTPVKPIVTPPVAPPVQSAPAIETPPAIPNRVVLSNDERRPSRAKPILLTLASFILIGAGLFEAYVLYQKTLAPEQDTAPVPIVVQSIIPHDEQVSIATSNEISNQLISKMYAELNKRQVAQGKNVEIVLTKTNGQNIVRMGAAEFIQKLNTQMPDVIERSLTDRWMFGAYGEENGTKTSFLALTTDFFQNAFAGMLSWEQNDMADDLALLLNFKEKARRDELSTSTVSSYFSIKGSYSDKVLKNRDVREFRNEKGELLFLYSFINKETMLLTTTESAFIALIDRVEKDAYVR